MLSRPQNGKPLLREIDGLRFLAILGTILTHESTFLSKHAPEGLAGLVSSDLTCQLMFAGCVGVPLFFAISGFILGLPFAQAFRGGTAPPSLKQFYWRRLTRIEPPYLLNLCLFYLILVLCRGISAGELFPHLVASGTYLHYATYGTASLVNGVAWSLEVEIQFYLLAPLLAQLFRIPSALLRRSIFALGTLLLACLGRFTDSAHDWTLAGQLEHFLVGFLAADLFLGLKTQPNQGRGAAFDVLGAASLVGLVLTSWQGGPQHPLVPLMSLGTFAGALRGNWLKAILASTPISTLGGMCYTTYLYHYWIMSVIGWGIYRYLPLPASLPAQAAILGAFMIPAIFIACGGLFLLTEKPFMKSDWPSRLWNRIRLRRDASPGTVPSAVIVEAAPEMPRRRAA